MSEEVRQLLSTPAVATIRFTGMRDLEITLEGYQFLTPGQIERANTMLRRRYNELKGRVGQALMEPEFQKSLQVAPVSWPDGRTIAVDPLQNVIEQSVADEVAASQKSAGEEISAASPKPAKSRDPDLTPAEMAKRISKSLKKSGKK